MNFTKIDQSLHSKANYYLKKIITKSLINKNKNNSKNKNIKILKYLKKINDQVEQKNKYGGTWEWIDRNIRGDKVSDSIKTNLTFQNKLENFFRNELSFGLISSHWEKKNKDNWKINLSSDILKNINTWEEFSKEKNDEFKYLDSRNDPGNPYGIVYKKKLILYDTPRHDYYAKKIINLFKNSKKKPIIFEIGGGYGGLLNQLIKRNFKFKYINIDLINTLITNIYYIASSHRNSKLIFKKKIIKSDLKKNDIFFMPFSKKIFSNINFNVDLVFNSNSLSEMNLKTIKNYFKLINKKLCPKYILHQNSNILLYPNSNLHVEIQSKQFPIDKLRYEQVYTHPSLFQGGSGRYREYLFKKKN